MMAKQEKMALQAHVLAMAAIVGTPLVVEPEDSPLRRMMKKGEGLFVKGGYDERGARLAFYDQEDLDETAAALRAQGKGAGGGE